MSSGRSGMSLKRRILLILMVATVAVQVLSFGGVGMLRGLDARMLRNDALARDIAYAYDELLAMDPASRRQKAAQMRRGGYAFEIVSPREIEAITGREDLRSILARMRTLSARPPAALSVVADPQTDLLSFSLDREECLLVRFDKPLESTRPPLLGIALYVLFVSIGVISVVWIAVRLATRPLEVFTQAAHRLAHNVDTEPLATDGPVEVREAARAFNAMHVEIRRQLQERSQILAAISHDLKTPLTRLKLRLSTQEPTEQRALMEADVDSMAVLIQDGLDYAHSQKLRETRVPVDLNRLVESIVEQAIDMGYDCQMDGHCGRPFPAAPRALERVLQNLVDNGLRYGQRVRIRLLERQDEVEIEVRDDGPGLPTDMLERVLEPYFRAESSRNRSTGGTGLGLAIARNLVQAHGGRIWLEQGEPAGLVARVRLPWVTAVAPA